MTGVFLESMFEGDVSAMTHVFPASSVHLARAPCMSLDGRADCGLGPRPVRFLSVPGGFCEAGLEVTSMAWPSNSANLLRLIRSVFFHSLVS